MNRLDELWRIVASIPSGRVASYGAVGRAMENPVSGVLIGKWMANCPSRVPWWRVVGADGFCPVWKRDADLFKIQRERLLVEGVQFVDDRVQSEFFWNASEELA